ncbi:hypothetical protein PR370_18615 [Mycobacterium marinum]|uniref:hypothetical protein n=1 Tax=Mycobacterium marinum TaxID=1781 RepID=UPI0023595ED5|nr:hypothetical protein [Mycobacterium marinum]MDC8984358.1 hypothetical protein [Mycobacterium marinum]MDC9001451.1 hypothetical protein [Mycobacterium marinum]MDC9012045.1 hypothetical protein [Mycobacterium marinum]
MKFQIVGPPLPYNPLEELRKEREQQHLRRRLQRLQADAARAIHVVDALVEATGAAARAGGLGPPSWNPDRALDRHDSATLAFANKMLKKR